MGGKQINKEKTYTTNKHFEPISKIKIISYMEPKK